MGLDLEMELKHVLPNRAYAILFEMAIWLNESDVRAVLPMGDLIECMEAALIAFSSGQVRQPVREVIEAGGSGNFFAAMPAWLAAGPAMGAKLVTVYHANGSLGLPTHQAAIVLLDAGTGSLVAVMDGRYITEARTAAVSAAALRRLARPGARTLAILGSGVQAGSHLQAFSLVWKFDDVRCWSPTAANRRSFAEMHPEVRLAESAEAAVRGADVILLATGSPVPVLWNQWVSAGACVISVGACRPYQREMDPLLVARGRVIVDSRAAALKEAGDLVMAMAEDHFGAEHIAGELGEVLAGRVAGRIAEDEVTILKPLGQAVEDVAAAQLAYTRAMAMGRGVPLG
jgi:ornithine cyclodeaminase/alanine dehydrogenase-like protein (mu-crystallin family)